MASVTSESLKTSIVNYLGAAIGFFFTLFIAPKVFTTEDNGLFRLILEISLLLATYAQFGLPLVIKKYYYPVHLVYNKEKGFNFFIFFTPLIIFAFFLFFFILWGSSLLNYLSNSASELINYTVYLLILVFAYLYLGVIEAYLSVLHKLVFINFIRNVLLKFFNIISAGIYFFTENFELTIFFLSFSTLFSTLIAYIYLCKQKKMDLYPSLQFVEKEGLKLDLSKYMGYVFIANIGLFLIQKIDIILLGVLSSLTSVAYYATAYALVGILLIPYQSILSVSFPLIVKKFQLEQMDELVFLLKDNAIFSLLMSIILYITIGANLDSIYALMPNGSQYIVGKYVFLIIGLGRLFDISIGSVGQIITVSKYYYWGLFITVSTSLFSVFLSYFLIKNYDFIGAAFGISFSAIFSALVQIIIVYKLFKIQPFSRKNVTLILISLPGFLVFLIPDLLHPIIMIIVKTTLVFAYFIFVLDKVEISSQYSEMTKSLKLKVNKFLKK